MADMYIAKERIGPYSPGDVIHDGDVDLYVRLYSRFLEKIEADDEPAGLVQLEESE